MDVPTFVYDAFFPNAITFGPVPAAPLPAPENGASWKSIADVSELLSQFTEGQLQFAPRAWTDAQLSYKLVGNCIRKAIEAVSQLSCDTPAASRPHAGSR